MACLRFPYAKTFQHHLHLWHAIVLAFSAAIYFHNVQKCAQD